MRLHRESRLPETFFAPVFVPGGGARWLRDQGVTVVEVAELADEARAVNAHLLP